MLRLKWLRKRFRKAQAQIGEERKNTYNRNSINRVNKGYHEDSDTTLFV